MSQLHCKLTVALLCVSSAACVSNPELCDPVNDPGFINTARCMFANEHGYKNRVIDLESNLEVQKALKSSLESMLINIKSEHSLTRAQVLEKQGDYGSLNRSWDSIREQLTQSSLKNEKLSQQIELIELDLSNLKKPINQSFENREMLLNDLRAHVASLNEDLDAGLF